nr:reverse transcriptase domain-containing protein [Tanacetum cinerariifolium]
MRVSNVPNLTIKLMLFPFSLEGAARIWLEKEPPRSILTWDDLVSKFINQFFPPSKTTNLRNEIMRFQQTFNESFSKAWDRFNDLLRAYLKGITTRSGVAYQGPTIPTLSKVTKQGTKVTKDQVQTSNSQSTAPVQPTVTQSESETPVSEPVVAPVSAPMPNMKPSIPYPSRRDNERRRDQANDSFGNKEKLSEMAQTPINEHCSAVILNKWPKKLGDPKKFLIPCEFPGMDKCLALADLGASINLMPLFVWKGLSLLELTPTCMTLELADQTESKPVSIAKDVKVKVGMSHFPADFVVVDFEPDPRVPLILGRCSINTSRALIDVHKGKLTLRIENESITYNLDQTSRYSAKYDQMMVNKIDVTDEACEEYSQEVLGFSNVTTSGSPTPSDEPIISTTSLTLTPFGDSDFLLFEEADAFLGLEDDPDSPKLDPSYYDLKGDILSLEAILNSDPSPPFPNHEQSVPLFKEELKACEAKTIKSSIDEPPEVELKDLPPHLEYVFLKGDNKLPVIIAKALRDEEKSALIKVLKYHKRAIAWKLSDIQGINPKFYTHKILIEEDYKPTVQNQRRVNPKIHGVIKKEVENFWMLDLCTRSMIVYGSARYIAYLKKKVEATRKGHFPLPFMDQMLERLAGNEYYCFLDGFSRYFQIPINPRDQEKTTFTCPYGTFTYRRMPFGLCNAPNTFQRCMLAIFHDMVKKTMEVFMDDFSVFGNSFENCLSRLDKMRQRCEDTKLYLNWEKSHFMVKEGIVLGHKNFKNGIEVNKAKIDVIAKLPHPTTVKDTPFVFSEDYIQAFQTLKKKLTEAPILIAPNWDLTFELMCDASDFAIDFANYHAGNFLVKGMSTQQKNKFFKDVKHYFWDDPFLFKVMRKYGVTHRLSTTYHPQTSGQVEEKTKRIHDSKIKNCVFNVGDQVLLLNSRLKIFSGKLKSRWSGPFTIAKVFSYGTVELSQANGPNFKVNGHRIKHYFGGDVPQLVVPDLQNSPLINPSTRGGGLRSSSVT